VVMAGITKGAASGRHCRRTLSGATVRTGSVAGRGERYGQGEVDRRRWAPRGGEPRV
jgi:hypothetical protein